MLHFDYRMQYRHSLSLLLHTDLSLSRAHCLPLIQSTFLLPLRIISLAIIAVFDDRQLGSNIPYLLCSVFQHICQRFAAAGSVCTCSIFKTFYCMLFVLHTTLFTTETTRNDRQADRVVPRKNLPIHERATI